MEQTEPTADDAVCRTIDGEDQANDFFTRVSTGDDDQISKITNLTIVIDGSSWTDYQDDIWSIALRAFAPYSQNLQCLEIIIRGNNLFTRYNYIKPIISSRVPFGYVEEDSSSSSDDYFDTPRSLRRSKKRPQKPKRLQEMQSPTSKTPELKYNKRFVPAEHIEMHITREKAIISAILSLHKPINMVAIRGYMELGLRRNLISTLNPNWNESTVCLTHSGFDSVDIHETDEVDRREEEFLKSEESMVKIGAADALQLQDDVDFDEFAAQEESGCKKAAKKDVPTGKAGRQVYGWRATAVGAWKGPRERLSSRFHYME